MYIKDMDTNYVCIIFIYIMYVLRNFRIVNLEIKT